MRTSIVQFPELETLAHSLDTIFNDDNSPAGQVTILAREPNLRTSTFPNEIVTCQLADGSDLQLLCKCEAGHRHSAFGHRGGIAFEAEVYGQVLQPLTVSTPTFYGLQKDVITGETCFILEYLDKCTRVRDSSDPILMRAAARWLGQFHRANESRLSTASLSFLNRHNAEYYLGWADRTSLLAGHSHQRFKWLARLCKRVEEIVDMLLEPPAIVIHGEYYPNNILFCRGTIYPVDWEAAAVAIGEIDLASLIDG